MSVLIEAARNLAQGVQALSFGPPVTRVYNPLCYAWEPHERYLRRYGRGRKRVLFLGMNPGPWGMAQTGIPFGEVRLVREWLGISGRVEAPADQHPKRPILGFSCTRSEVSGRRLWGLMKARFGTAEAFFQQHFVGNYCPLLFIEESGKNRTPDRLGSPPQRTLFRHCDEHLVALVEALEPEWVIGVGKFAEARIRRALADRAGLRMDGILHPSPANPRANRDWGKQVERQLIDLGVWPEE